MKKSLNLISKPIFKFIGIINLALRNVFRRKIRTLITSSAIAIGVILIVVMFSLGLGVNQWLVEAIATQTDMRLVTVFQQSFATKPIFKRLITPGNKPKKLEKKEKPVLSNETIDMFKKIPDVETVIPILGITVDSVLVEGEENPVYSPFVFAMPISRDTPNIKRVLAGDPYSLDKQSDGIVITTFFLRRLGIVEGPYEGWIGKRMILTVPTKIAPTGITATTVEAKTIQGIVIGVVDIGLENDDLFINLDAATELLAQSAEMSKDEFLNKIGYYTVLVRVGDVSNTRKVADVINELGFIAQTAEDYIKMINDIFTTVQIALSTFGVVSLVVAALGIANTMIMSIYERTREIGIMKAIGAPRGTIRVLFLTEAGLIGILGGLVGVLLGYGITQIGSVIISKLLQNQGIPVNSLFSYPLWLGVGSVVFSCLVGVIAGIYPSLKAASLDPVAAMRYE